MSEFEFLRSLPFGPYLPVDSPLHRLDPRTRILLALLLVTAVTLARSPLALVLGLIISLAGWRIGRAPYGPLLRGWWSTLPFLLILALLQVLFRVGPDAQVLLRIGSLVISWADVWAGLSLVLRFSAYMAIIGLAAACLSEAEITHGLEALLHPLLRLHIPVHDFVLAIQVTLRFFPMLAQVTERIAKAQASRGADWRPAGWNPIRRGRQVIPLIVPLFVTSLRRAENMALAMDARGYGSLPERTSLVTLHYETRDWLVLGLALLVSVGLIIMPAL